MKHLFLDLCLQLYCTKENTFPLSIKSVCGKIYQGPAGLSDKVRASRLDSQLKGGSSVCVALGDVFSSLTA